MMLMPLLLLLLPSYPQRKGRSFMDNRAYEKNFMAFDNIVLEARGRY
jgi:hypothetical protein